MTWNTDLITILIVLGNSFTKRLKTKGMGIANTIFLQSLLCGTNHRLGRGKVGFAYDHAYNIGGPGRASYSQRMPMTGPVPVACRATKAVGMPPA